MTITILLISIGVLILIAIGGAPAMASSFIPGPPDSQLDLQDSVTKTATFSGAWLDLGEGFAPGGIGMPACGVVDVTAADRASSDETYAINIDETDDDGTGAPDATKVRTCSVPVSVPVNGAVATLGLLLAKCFITGRFVRLTVTIAGTTPSITYSANLTP